MCLPLLWIRDILVRIRIADPCLWPMDPDPHPAPDPAKFRPLLPSKRQQKHFFQIFLLFTFWRYIYIIFQRSKVIKKSQNSRNQGFLLLLLLDNRRIRIRTSDPNPDPGGSKTYGYGSEYTNMCLPGSCLGCKNAVLGRRSTREGGGDTTALASSHRSLCCRLSGLWFDFTIVSSWPNVRPLHSKGTSFG